MAPTYNGVTLHYTQVGQLNEPARKWQIDGFPGADGVIAADLGKRDATVVVSGICRDISGALYYPGKATIDAMDDGSAHTLAIPTTGSYTNVIIDSIQWGPFRTYTKPSDHTSTLKTGKFTVNFRRLVPE